jgi:predicted nucleic acid-binding protein
MTAVFADTFYWILLADFSDSAHRRALTLTTELEDSPIVTTDEVLAEYLTFFATAPQPLRAILKQKTGSLVFLRVTQ